MQTWIWLLGCLFAVSLAINTVVLAVLLRRKATAACAATARTTRHAATAAVRFSADS